MFTQKTCSPPVGSRGFVGAWRLTKTGRQRGEELSSGPQQVVQLDVENADRYQQWGVEKKTGAKDGGRNNVREVFQRCSSSGERKERDRQGEKPGRPEERSKSVE